jgi:hypothetical protein
MNYPYIFLSYSSPKSFMRKIGLRLRSANNICWLSEVEASHKSSKYLLDGEDAYRKAPS